MITSVEGEEKTCKTTFAYTAPLKIVGFQFDPGWERALMGTKHDEYFKGVKIKFVQYLEGSSYKGSIKDLWADADIVLFELPTPVQIDQTKVVGMRELWTYFLGIVGEAIRDPLVRTMVVDTMTLARRVKADAYLQALQEVEQSKSRVKLLQIEYGAPNSAIRDLYVACNSTRKNLVAVHHLTDQYVSVTNSKGEREQVKSGMRVLEGLDGTHRLVDLAVLMSKDSKNKVKGRLLECGYNIDLTGLEVNDPTWDGLVDIIEATLGGRIKFERRQEK